MVKSRYRWLVLCFLVHFAVTITMGYAVAPAFETMVEPPPSPTALSRVIGLVYQVFALPVLVPLVKSGACEMTRPNVFVVFLNSLSATLIVGALVFALTRLSRRV